jgi:hypothetical protein
MVQALEGTAYVLTLPHDCSRLRFRRPRLCLHRKAPSPYLRAGRLKRRGAIERACIPADSSFISPRLAHRDATQAYPQRVHLRARSTTVGRRNRDSGRWCRPPHGERAPQETCVYVHHATGTLPILTRRILWERSPTALPKRTYGAQRGHGRHLVARDERRRRRACRSISWTSMRGEWAGAGESSRTTSRSVCYGRHDRASWWKSGIRNAHSPVRDTRVLNVGNTRAQRQRVLGDEKKARGSASRWWAERKPCRADCSAAPFLIPLPSPLTR